MFFFSLRVVLATMDLLKASRYSIAPIYLFMHVFIIHSLLHSPIHSWDKTNNPEPWNKLGPTDQYKFYAVNMDYSKLKKDRPDF
uniref:Cytochrome c oxidase subunit NDUFA4 n=1 Tax=Astyanax mexicanus TaxID=7994 RepID=A0A8B9HV36_ASTMX